MVQDEDIVSDEIQKQLEDRNIEPPDELWYFFPQDEEKCRSGRCNCAMH
jgi:hypothetical protein